MVQRALRLLALLALVLGSASPSAAALRVVTTLQDFASLATEVGGDRRAR